MQSYSTGKWHDRDIFECNFCRVTSFNENEMVEHTGRHKVIQDPMGIEQAEKWVFSQGKINSKVVLSLLCWNNGGVAVDSLLQLRREALRLKSMGADVSIVVLDNGTDDGSQSVLHRLCNETDEATLIYNRTNLGISVARNQVIEYALQVAKADFIIFIDGDIQPIPYSTYALLRYMHEAGEKLGCLGFYSGSHTAQVEFATPIFVSIDERLIRANIKCAWTQYGIFRADMFREGIKFEESGPFAGPGWGLEDVDMYYQIIDKGYECKFFMGARYLHRDRNSSLRELGRIGINNEAIFQRRKLFLHQKWSRVRNNIFGLNMPDNGNKGVRRVGDRQQTADLVRG